MIRFGDSGNFSAPLHFPAQKEWQIVLALLERNQMYADLSDNADLSQRNDKMTRISENNSILEFTTIGENESVFENSSNTSSEHIFTQMPLTPRDYVLVFLYSVTTLLAIIGNLLAIVIFTKGKRSKTDLRPFLINLAIADLIMAIFCIPFTFTYQLLNHWIFSKPMCPVVMFLQMVSVTGSVTTNMAIGIDRFCAIAFPLNASRNTPLRYRIIILVIWIVSVAFASVQAFVGKAQSNPTTGLTECKEHWESPDLAEFYTILVLILTYLLPVIILTVTYSIVGYILWKRNLPGNADASRDKMQLNSKIKVHARWVPRLLKEHEMTRRVSDSRAFLRRTKQEGDDFLSRIITTDETWLWLHDPETRAQSAVWKRSGPPPPKKARVSKSGGKYMFIMFADMHGMILQHVVPKNQTVNAEYYCKIIKMLVTIVVLFVLCWLPLHTFFLVISFKNHVDPASLSLPYFICHWVAMSNSFVNPIVYGTLNDSFRADFKQLVFRCIPIRTRSGTTRQGAVKIKYPAERYKLTYSSKRNATKPNYQTQNSYEGNYDECNNSSFSDATVMKMIDSN